MNGLSYDRWNRIQMTDELKKDIREFVMTSLKDSGITEYPGFSTYFCWSKAYIASGRYDGNAGDFMLKVRCSFSYNPFNIIKGGKIYEWRTEEVWFALNDAHLREQKLNKLLNE